MTGQLGAAGQGEPAGSGRMAEPPTDDDLLEWQTSTQRAYGELRARILDGRLTPGSKIIVRVLSEELGLSPTPIKNALTALEREGFLQTVAYRGYSVPHTDPEVVQQAFEVLCALDLLAIRRIIAGPQRQRAVTELRAMIDGQRVGPAGGEGGGRAGFELNFHKALWELSGNQQLVVAAEHQRGLVLVASGGLLELPERRPQVLAEHLAVVAALARGDAEAATLACEQHMALSARSAIEQMAPAREGR